MDDGIVIIENSGRVLSCNSKAREVLGNPGEIVGSCVADLIPGITFDEVLESSREVDYTLVKIQSRNVSVKVVPVLAGGTKKGALAILSKFDERERSQHRLRSQLLGKGHRARYTFDNIQTKDDAFQEVKTLARKKAKSEASVLIIGETGTGKELFAHAIHNSSQRKAWPFVAINCAALPESLLESELFGYEEGAFTGARRGGKPGLFELAHKGTIFLDEIGEMNLSLQARLLRVLENREVMRIGGDTMINVDIRVIAATNKELWQLVEEGSFRKDLYYRLNVLPIQIPPLRERPSDILFILERMLHAMGVCLTLGEDVPDLIHSYPWPGNVRELKNVAEYLAYLDKNSIEAKDIMPVLRWPASTRLMGNKVTASMLENFGPDQAHCRFLLERLHASHKQKTRMGRRTLCQQAMEQDIFLTEAQIRKLLVQLEAQGLVRMSSGRGGTVITPSGIEFLQQPSLHRLHNEARPSP
jgi:transcriptional regulator with PAS, ATPase and Fis domain